MNRQQPVSVSGMGCICAAGKNLPDCMEALFTQAPTPAPPRSLPEAQHPVFEVPDRFLPASDFQNMSMVRAVRLALAATNEALTDAGLTPAALAEKTGRRRDRHQCRQRREQPRPPERIERDRLQLFVAGRAFPARQPGPVARTAFRFLRTACDDRQRVLGRR